MNLSTPFYILSASHEHFNVNDNVYRSNLLGRTLRAQGFATAVCEGAYKGVPERSILVIDERPNTDECYNAVIRLANVYNQESVLTVDANRNAHLVFCDGRPPVRLGIFTCVSEEEAKAQDAYTSRAGRYYVCKPL